MSKQIGLFGIGLIGTSIAKRLLAQGNNILGHDPSDGQMDALQKLGGTPTSVRNVWATDTIIAAVFDTDQVADLISNATPLKRTTLIVTSTCDPDRMPALAEDAAKKGIDLIEAPLSGTSKDLADGNAVFLVAGAEELVNDLEWLWNCLGRSYHYVGDIGNGNRSKLAINLVLGLNRAALAEGLVYASVLGIDPESFLPLLQDSAAASAVMKSKGPKMVNKDFAPLGRIAQSAKDFGLIHRSAAAAGQHLPFASTYLEMMKLGIDNGHEDLDNAAILLAIEKATLPD